MIWPVLIKNMECIFSCFEFKGFSCLISLFSTNLSLQHRWSLKFEVQATRASFRNTRRTTKYSEKSRKACTKKTLKISDHMYFTRLMRMLSDKEVKRFLVFSQSGFGHFLSNCRRFALYDSKFVSTKIKQPRYMAGPSGSFVHQLLVSDAETQFFS